ncbi:squalene--hopene cyclase [Paenibacillus silvisoli]|uniref:squalene--hopene cyclase n=1 Tax=Paenibacillus silvisoli TaxID=3110539 RepID=UPI00280495FE|nr:squalene--hopene cyclase [Paenibacillus silvisoli]
MNERIQAGIDQLVRRLLSSQSADGSWRLGFIEEGMSTDAAAVMLLTGGGFGKPNLVSSLRDRILAKQHDDGAWRVYPDEDGGNLSATAESYFALQFAGISANEPKMKRAREAIQAMGGLQRIDSLLTKFMLATVGQYDWPRWFPVPLSLLLLPQSAPLHFFQFSCYARVHMAPMMLLGDRKPAFTLPHVEPLPQQPAVADTESWLAHFDQRLLVSHARGLFDIPGITAPTLRKQGTERAVQFMRQRLEPDGTLYCYASATMLMVQALRALGFANSDLMIARAIDGLSALVTKDNSHTTMQNTTSTVWDTALISHALQEAGTAPAHPAIRAAGRYLLSRQHTKLGDWKLRADTEHPEPGGWGFSDTNTINPDMDDTTASLRALKALGGGDSDTSGSYRDASERGLQWLLAMQNTDGGWAAFERNTNNRIISWVPLDGAEDAATDPSTPDLTGRTLDYLGRCEGLTAKGSPFIRRAADWLYKAQERNGSWYGRWGVCYLYGTWAALTGLTAVGEPPDHPQIRRAVDWLYGVQNGDGGFGESCRSDRVKRFVPLPYSTLSQTAWALDALTSVTEGKPTEAMERACSFLLETLQKSGRAAQYPTGAGLPGYLYTRYDSYSLIWPLLALANYRSKFLR